MIPTRSARTSASSRYCVVRKTVTPSSVASRCDLVPQRAAALRVQARGRLVEEEDRRPVHERQGEVEAALHAAGVAADLAVGRLGQPDALEQLGRRGSRGRPWPGRAGPPCRSMCSRPVRKLSSAASWSAAPMLPAHVGALGGDVEARHRRAARRGRQQRGEHVDGGRLAGAVGPEEAVDLARRDLEVDAVDGVDVALECRERGPRRRCRDGWCSWRPAFHIR